MKVLVNLITAVSFMLLSCATTKLTAVWETSDFDATISKIVVIGTFKSPSIRNIFEDEFVENLRAYGVEAVPSYRIVSIEKLWDREFVMARMKETGADAVLVTRLLDRKTVRTYVPARIHTMPYYYHKWGHYHNYIYSPGYIVDEDYAYAETNIYRVSNEEMIWSARSETLISGTNEKLIRSFAKTIVDRLSEGRLLSY